MESAKTKRWMWAGASSIAAGLVPLLLTIILQRGWWVPWALLLVIGCVEIVYGLLVCRHADVRANTDTEIRM